MKKVSRLFLFVLMIATFLLSACGGTTATSTAGGGSVEPIPVAFIGTVDSMAGDQWVIDGQTVTVAPDVVQDGPFAVGDRVKVEGSVNADGSFRVSNVELPTAQDSSSLPPFGGSNSSDDNSNDSNTDDSGVNSNDDNANTVNSNDANTNDDNGNGVNTNDDGNGANTNDDNGDDSNSNDDGGGNDNSDDSNSNDDDDNSSSGGGNNNDDDDDGDDDNGNDD